MAPSDRTASCTEVLEIVSALTGISLEALLGPGRARIVSRVRSAAMHLLRTEAGLSAREVGRVFGRTEGTVGDLSQLVARGERASELVAEVRTTLRVRGAASRDEIGSSWKSRPIPGLSAQRRAAGLSQPELAARIGIARETLSRIERGRPARPEIAARLAAALETTPPRPNPTQTYRVSGLAFWRTRARLPQQELAARAGVARETLSRLEAGRPARWTIVESLARALLLMPSVLTGNSELDPGDQPARRCTECQALRPIQAFLARGCYELMPGMSGRVEHKGSKSEAVPDGCDG